MGLKFEDILAELITYRRNSYSDDSARRDAQLETIEWCMQAMLERLRDKENMSGAAFNP
jgi:hypothetical protein